MKKLINTGLLLFAIAMLFNACRKDDDNVKQEEARMSFIFTKEDLLWAMKILATPEELKGFFIDLGDGTFVPVSENSRHEYGEYFSITTRTKGKNLRLKGKVKGIEISSPDLVSMDVSQNILLEKLFVRNSIATFAQLDLTKNTELKEITFSSSGLASLDLSQNTKLVEVEISVSPLKQINFPADNQIEKIVLVRTPLSQIDLSQSKKLIHLSLFGNPVTTIDLSKNTLLRYLHLGKNNLAKLNLSTNQDLISLLFYKNKVNSLVLPASFPKLGRVDCYSNLLSTAQMDALANTLSNAVTPSTNHYRFTSIDRKDAGEKNVTSVAVVNKIKAKGWKVYDANGSEDASRWLEYSGS